MIALLLLLLAPGCRSTGPYVDVTAPEALDALSASMGVLWVANFELVPCTASGNVYPLFGNGSLPQRREQALNDSSSGAYPGPPSSDPVWSRLPPGLQQHCFRVVGELVPAEGRDHIAVRVAGVPELPSAATEELFRVDAGRALSNFGRFVPPAQIGERLRARLVFLDTSPDDGTVLAAELRPTEWTRGADLDVGFPPNTFHAFDRDSISAHGSTLANLAGAVLCGDIQGSAANLTQSNCAAEIHTRLALPEKDATLSPLGSGWTPDTSGTGGVVGSIGELAAAVTAEVDDYLTTGGRSDAVGLVLNISAGFAASWQTNGAATADVTALRDALYFARCNGALIFAAEGNGIVPGSPQAMLAPARWFKGANEPSGTRSCASFLTPGRTAALWNLEAPLVYPVGAVAVTPGSGAPSWPVDVLPSFPRAALRTFGGPFSAKLPTGVLYPTTAGDLFGMSLSGSSVSTALASSLAAARWGMGETCGDPWPTTSPLAPLAGDADLADIYSADEVFQDLLAGCTSTTVPSSTLAVASSAPSPVTLATGLAIRACTGPTDTSCGEAEAAPSPASLGTFVVSPTSCSVAATRPPGCTLSSALDCDALATTQRCATTDIYSTSTNPWVVTMPPPPHCPACFWQPPTAGGTGTLYVEYPPNPSGATGDVKATVTFINNTARVAEVTDLSIHTSGAQAYSLSGVGTGVKGAWLSVFDGVNAESCPVRILSAGP